MIFENLNVNPKQWKDGDCVVRALAKATGYDWLEVYDELYKIGRKKCRMMNSKIVYETFLEQEGFIKMKMPRHYDNSKYTIRELIEEEGNNKILVISIANHLTTSQNNVLYDIWNCSKKYVCNYYYKIVC